MEVQVKIRPVQAEDVLALVQVKKLTWPEEEVRLGQVEKVLHDPTHEVFVADAQGTLAGFVDGFSTHSAQGELRWEVDLLAVHPDWRGRQLGQRLVDACLAAGREPGAAFARALIQMENTASQITFERCGFQRRPTVLRLFVALNDTECSPLAAGSGHLLTVNTFNYSGLWLEEDYSERSLVAAHAACCQAELDLVGALVIQANLVDNGKMSELGFIEVGDYQWWTKPFLESQGIS